MFEMCIISFDINKSHHKISVNSSEYDIIVVDVVK